MEAFEEPKTLMNSAISYTRAFTIYTTAFLKPAVGDYQIQSGQFFYGLIYQARDYLLSIITRYVKGKNEFAVASAIMLGYNDYLTGDITRAYASSGALHVLSVSGLHVGIMFFMLNILFKPMDFGVEKLRLLKQLLLFPLLWGYACLI
ncbi:MAG: ComEC/Rec2 family competence protein [Chitinophagales bacterium]